MKKYTLVNFMKRAAEKQKLDPAASSGAPNDNEDDDEAIEISESAAFSLEQRSTYTDLIGEGTSIVPEPADAEAEPDLLSTIIMPLGEEGIEIPESAESELDLSSTIVMIMPVDEEGVEMPESTRSEQDIPSEQEPPSTTILPYDDGDIETPEPTESTPKHLSTMIMPDNDEGIEIPESGVIPGEGIINLSSVESVREYEEQGFEAPSVIPEEESIKSLPKNSILLPSHISAQGSQKQGFEASPILEGEPDKSFQENLVTSPSLISIREYEEGFEAPPVIGISPPPLKEIAVGPTDVESAIDTGDVQTTTSRSYTTGVASEEFADDIEQQLEEPTRKKRRWTMCHLYIVLAMIALILLTFGLEQSIDRSEKAPQSATSSQFNAPPSQGDGSGTGSNSGGGQGNGNSNSAGGGDEEGDENSNPAGGGGGQGDENSNPSEGNGGEGGGENEGPGNENNGNDGENPTGGNGEGTSPENPTDGNETTGSDGGEGINTDVAVPTEPPSSMPSSVPTASPIECVDRISVDANCYGLRDSTTMTVSFEQCNPRDTDWVAIYPAGSNAQFLGDDYLDWNWACGNKSCIGEAHSNTIRFRLNMSPGWYQAFLVIDDDLHPYQSVVGTDPFLVTFDCSNFP